MLNEKSFKNNIVVDKAVSFLKKHAKYVSTKIII